jgi:hypothetical protein
MMDSRLVNERAEGYRDRVIRITPAVMAQLGLEKRGSHLKLEEFFVSCVPFDLGLSKASVLCFLSQNELAFFDKMRDRAHTLNLVCLSPDTGKPAPFFIRCEILAFRKPDPSSPYCFIDLRWKETPFVLKELLVNWFVASEEAELFWNDSGDEKLSPEAVAQVFPGAHLELLKDGAKAKLLRVASLSAKRLRLFGEYEGTPPAIGEVLDVEAAEGDISCVIRGPCVEWSPFAEVPGFAFLGIEPQFNPCLASRMQRVWRPRGAGREGRQG